MGIKRGQILIVFCVFLLLLGTNFIFSGEDTPVNVEEASVTAEIKVQYNDDGGCTDDNIDASAQDNPACAPGPTGVMIGCRLRSIEVDDGFYGGDDTGCAEVQKSLTITQSYQENLFSGMKVSGSYAPNLGCKNVRVDDGFQYLCSDTLLWAQCSQENEEKVAWANNVLYRCAMENGFPVWNEVDEDIDHDGFTGSQDCRDNPNQEGLTFPEQCPATPQECGSLQYSQCAICINPSQPEVCGDGTDNDCDSQTSDDCHRNQYACEQEVPLGQEERPPLNNVQDTKFSWIDTAAGGYCCGFGGVGDVGKTSVGGGGYVGNYVCLNKNLVSVQSGEVFPAGQTGCGDDWCLVAAGSNNFNIYTIAKPGEQPYDIVSNNQNWFACNATTGEGTHNFASDALDSRRANGFYCYQEGNRWSWAQCRDTRLEEGRSNSKEKLVGESLFSLPLPPVTEEGLSEVEITMENYPPRLDVVGYPYLEFAVEFVGHIDYPAEVQLIINGPSQDGQPLKYVNMNVSSYAITNPLLQPGNKFHIKVPIPEMLDVKSIKILAQPESNHFRISQLSFRKEGDNRLCSGEASRDPNNNAWIPNVDFWSGPHYNAEKLCQALYTDNSWLGHTVPADKRCCGNTPAEYYAGPSEEHNDKFYGCWNSQPVASGETVMNVEAVVESSTTTKTFTYPEEEFDVSLNIRTLAYDKLDGAALEALNEAAYTCPNIADCAHLQEYIKYFVDNRCSSVTTSTCSGPSPTPTCSVFYTLESGGSSTSIPVDCQQTIEETISISVASYSDLPPINDIPDYFTTYLVQQAGPQQGYYRLTKHDTSQDFPDQTISFRNSPLRVASVDVNQEDFEIQGDYHGFLTLQSGSLSPPVSSNPRVKLYFLDPLGDKLSAPETTFGAEGAPVNVYLVELDSKNLPPGKSTIYIMAEVKDELYRIEQRESTETPPSTTLKYTCTPDANTPDSEGTTSCIYPLPGNPPYKITNPHPDLYELSFVSISESGEEHSQPITNDPDQIFTVPGNLRAEKVAQQVLFVSQEEPEVDTGFYGCQAADYLNEHAEPAASVDNLPSCSVKAGKFCAPSILHKPSDDIKDRFTTINSWDTHVLRQIGYDEVEESANQPDVNAFYASDTVNLREAEEGETAATDRNYSSAVLPARNIISNSEFQTTVRDLPHWQVLNAEGNELNDERDAIQENTITLLPGMLLRSERIAVPQNTDFHLSFTGTAAARIILVDKEGTRETIIESDFSTGDASYLLLEFLPGTVSQPMLQKVDDKGPVDYYAVDSGLSEDATARAGVACCPQNYCWNGYACVEPMGKYTYLAEHIGEGRDYRCINGEWTYQPVKKDWQENQWGFCSSKEQCFVLSSLQGGDSEKAANDFYQSQYPSCINDGEYIFDNYCDKGNWTSRTKFLATKLLDVAGSEDYALYCADYRTALNSYQAADNNLGGTIPQQPGAVDLAQPVAADTQNTCFSLTNEGNLLVPTEHNTCINNVCVLQHDGKTAFATSLNKDIHASDSFLLALNVPTSKLREACRGESPFVHCNAADLGIEGDLWYSPKLNAVIYSQDSISVTPTIIDKLVNFFRELFTASSLSAEREFVEKAQNFKDIYLASQAGKKVRAIKEVFPGVKQTLIAEYENFDTPVCDYVNSIAAPDQEQPLAAASGQQQFSCTEDENIQRVEMLQNIDFFWTKLTGQLRIG